jgi:L-asparagine transporter-like permease
MLWRSQVVEAWHTVRWVWLAVVVAYVVLQTVALRRLSGDLKKCSHRVWSATLAAFIAVWSVQMVFENRELDAITSLILGAVCLAAIAVLAKALRQQKACGAEDRES